MPGLSEILVISLVVGLIMLPWVLMLLVVVPVLLKRRGRPQSAEADPPPEDATRTRERLDQLEWRVAALEQGHRHSGNRS